MTETSHHDAVIPQSAGPYRITHFLGKGGMGEVYSGYDARLDRPVALKRIRPGTREPEKALDRFRREARAVAKLHHPSIVQVHDWVETDDGHWIVMELVEGHSLRHVLRNDGPLTAHQAALMARDILQGLVAAHALGILHRDLKAENVMLTHDDSVGPRRRAKILDFGLAAPLESGDYDDGPQGETLGTVSAVSPEQILEKRADQRSDLFSLGNLLYELVTGNFPFLGPSTRETLVRVCTHRHPSAKSLNPLLPEPFSALIDRLLEKDPRRRPADAQEALAQLDDILAQWPEEPGDTAAEDAAATPWEDSSPTLDMPTLLSGEAYGTPRPRPHKWAWGAAGVTVLAALAIFFGGRDTTPRPMSAESPSLYYVAVPATEMVSAVQDAPATESLALAASAVNTALLRGLSEFRGLAAMEPRAASAGIEDPRDLARSMAVDEVLASRLECGRESCNLILRRLHGADSHVLWTRAFRVETDRYLDISRATLEHLRRAYEGYELDEGIAEFGVREDDYAAYLRLRHRSKSRDQGLSDSELLAALENLESTSPEFLALPLFRAAVLARRYQEARDDGDLAQARQAIDKALAMAPRDPRVLIRQAQVARISGDLETAQSALDKLRRLEPGDPLGLHQQALFYDQIGEDDKAMALMQQVIERQPAASFYFDLADMAYRRGDAPMARKTLEQGLLLAPQYFNGISRLAQLELFGGSPQRAAELYEQLVARSPEATELTNLGTAYMLLADNQRAAARFREALERAPSSPFALLNLADAELLAGHRSVAMELYKQLVERIAEDENPDGLRAVQAQALAHLGQAPQARRAIERALALKPNHPWVAYEAAVVYTLIGDHDDALAHIERALDGGVEARWFSFAWFSPISGAIDQLAEADASKSAA